MQIDIFTGNLSQREADCLVVGVHDGGVLCDAAAALDRRASTSDESLSPAVLFSALSSLSSSSS